MSALSTMSLPSLKTHYCAVSPQSKATVGNGRPTAAAKVISSARMPATFSVFFFFFLSGHLRLKPSPKTSSLFTLPQSLAPSSRPSPFQLFSVLSLCLTKQDRARSLYTGKKTKKLKRKKTGRAAWVKGIEEDYIYFGSFPSILPPLNVVITPLPSPSRLCRQPVQEHIASVVFCTQKSRLSPPAKLPT